MTQDQAIVQALQGTARWVPLLVVGLAVAGGVWLEKQAPEKLGEPPVVAALPDWQAPAAIAADAWAVFTPPVSAERPTSGIAQRIRLVGTFLQEDAEASVGKALLEFVESKRQRTVAEGEIILGAYRIKDVGESSIVVSGPEGDVTLWRKGLVKHVAVSANPPGKQVTFDDAPALETSRFGKRIAENQWVLKRESLLAYHDELMGDPSRLSQLLLSFDENEAAGEVNGYRIDVKGENGFFDDLGMQPGDVINKVNHMRMINHGRARFFLREFMEARVPMFILDVERNGKSEKLMYLIR